MSFVAVNLRVNEGCENLPVPFPDLVWDVMTGTADFALAQASEKQNVGGLQALRAIETAVIICLFTDQICPPGHPLAGGVSPDDPRGWWGDGVDVRADLGEAPLGSLLWLLERSVVTPQTAIWAQTLAIQAMQPMIDQVSIVAVDAQAFVYPPSRLDLAVQVYGRDGAKVYARQFDDIWTQVRVNGIA